MGDSKTSEDTQGDPPTPSWLDEALIQKALRNCGEENLQVKAISVHYATSAGDNYGSSVYRVKATLSDGEMRSFIVKGPAPGAALSDLSSQMGIFKRETAMLSEVIPQMEALLEKAAPGKFPPLAPRCYHHGTHPVEFLVVEDLAPGGFRLGDRKRGLGLRHSLLVLRSIARFHAASYAFLQREPAWADRLTSSWRVPNPGMKMFIDGSLQSLVEACRSWSGFEQYAERIEKFTSNAMAIITEMLEPVPGEFNVIIHGDFWVTNMMLCYEDGYPKDFRSIDLQQSHVASPALDILFFLASSVSEDVHINHQDLLLREYHVALKETMELLGYQAPSLESVLAEFDAHGQFSMFILCGVAAMKTEGAADVNAMFSGDNSSMVRLFQLPKIKKWMQRTIPDYARRGWLPV